jgi:hypothetical protein
VAIGNASDVNEEIDHRIDNTSEPRAMVQHPDYVIQGETKWQNERVMGAARERSSGTGRHVRKAISFVLAAVVSAYLHRDQHPVRLIGQGSSNSQRRFHKTERIMGLFSKIGKKKLPQTMTRQEALVTLLCSLIVKDPQGPGDDKERELYRLRSLYARCPIFAGTTTKQDDELTSKVLDWLSLDLEENLLPLAGKALLDGYEETAFAMACDIAFANGDVSDKEEAFLTQMYQTYAPFSEDRAVAIMSTFSSLYQP